MCVCIYIYTHTHTHTRTHTHTLNHLDIHQKLTPHGKSTIFQFKEEYNCSLWETYK